MPNSLLIPKTMTTIKCPQCELTNWSTETNCKRCKFAFQSENNSVIPKPTQPLPESSFADLAEPDFEKDILPSHSRTPQMLSKMNAHRSASQRPVFANPITPPTNFTSKSDKTAFDNFKNKANDDLRRAAFNPSVSAKTKNGLAIASAVLGIIGLFTSFILIGFVFALIGLGLGITALIKARKSPAVFGGKSLAVFGIVLSSIIVLFIPIVAAIAIPNLLAARRAANEASAITSIKLISSAQETFMTMKKTSKCGDLQDLGKENFIDDVLAKGEENGYHFQLVHLQLGGCEINATPLSTVTGMRSFYFSTEDGIIRTAQRNGLVANRKDMPLSSQKDF